MPPDWCRPLCGVEGRAKLSSYHVEVGPRDEETAHAGLAGDYQGHTSAKKEGANASSHFHRGIVEPLDVILRWHFNKNTRSIMVERPRPPCAHTGRGLAGSTQASTAALARVAHFAAHSSGGTPYRHKRQPNRH